MAYTKVHIDLTVSVLIFEMFDYVNTVAFVLVVMRLKAVEIYMDEKNRTEKDINNELEKLRIIRVIYGIVFAITLLNNTPMFSFEQMMFSTKAFAWYNLVEITIAIPFFFAVHGYLVIMSLNMQRIFRKYG